MPTFITSLQNNDKVPRTFYSRIKTKQKEVRRRGNAIVSSPTLESFRSSNSVFFLSRLQFLHTQRISFTLKPSHLSGAIRDRIKKIKKLTTSKPTVLNMKHKNVDFSVTSLIRVIELDKNATEINSCKQWNKCKQDAVLAVRA